MFAICLLLHFCSYFAWRRLPIIQHSSAEAIARSNAEVEKKAAEWAAQLKLPDTEKEKKGYCRSGRSFKSRSRLE